MPKVDHDNASVATAAIYDNRGVYLFVALETSREVAVVDAHGGSQVMRFVVGRAPQGLALSADGNTLYVNNFMDRTVGVYDLQPLLAGGQLSVPPVANLGAVASENLTASVLLGKQHFYDARDTRLALDRYMSCATCHNDGGSDGRTWDLTSLGEGLRNTVALRGRAGAQGLLHWSANFDEVQDFEGQIRALAGGAGLMSNLSFNAGTRSQPLGDPKTGVSGDLDSLAAYLGSLNSFEPTSCRVHRPELRCLPRRRDVHELGLDGIAEHRHAQALQRPAIGCDADRHRHPDAARRLAQRPVPARRLRADVGSRCPGAQWGFDQQCRPRFAASVLARTGLR
jgi:hypothetical protein